MRSRYYHWRPGWEKADIKDYQETMDYFSFALFHKNGKRSEEIIQKKRKWEAGDKANTHLNFWKEYKINGYELSSVFVTVPLDN